MQEDAFDFPDMGCLEYTFPFLGTPQTPKLLDPPTATKGTWDLEKHGQSEGVEIARRGSY